MPLRYGARRGHGGKADGAFEELFCAVAAHARLRGDVAAAGRGCSGDGGFRRIWRGNGLLLKDRGGGGLFFWVGARGGAVFWGGACGARGGGGGRGGAGDGDGGGVYGL